MQLDWGVIIVSKKTTYRAQLNYFEYRTTKHNNIWQGKVKVQTSYDINSRA